MTKGTQKGMQRIMFVCRKNSARSQMAEGFAKQLGARQLETGLLQVKSSGLEASHVRPEAIATMDAVGIDIRQQTSNALAEFSPDAFDVVISLCGCGVILPEPWLRRQVFEDWQLDDPAEHPEIFPRVRDEIRGRVKTLLLSLRTRQRSDNQSGSPSDTPSDIPTDLKIGAKIGG